MCRASGTTDREEVLVDLRVGQVVAGDVGDPADALVDVVLVRVGDHVLGQLFLVAEERLLVEEGGHVAVHHARVVTHPHLPVEGSVVRRWAGVAPKMRNMLITRSV